MALTHQWNVPSLIWSLLIQYLVSMLHEYNQMENISLNNNRNIKTMLDLKFSYFHLHHIYLWRKEGSLFVLFVTLTSCKSWRLLLCSCIIEKPSMSPWCIKNIRQIFIENSPKPKLNNIGKFGMLLELLESPQWVKFNEMISKICKPSMQEISNFE